MVLDGKVISFFCFPYSMKASAYLFAVSDAAVKTDCTIMT